jgi:diguanylate cyclase (GGDEF)-like protein
MKKYGYLKNHIGTILLWPAACLLLALVVWGITLSKIGMDREEAEKNAYTLAVSLSDAYSEQLARTVEQIDALTLSLKYYWEHNNGKIDLQDQLREGLYPPSSDLYLTVIDRNGVGVASTLGGPQINVADRAYFQFHRAHPEAGLRLDPSLNIGRRSGRAVIRFTRRLNAANGSFDGIVSVGVEPEFLASFNDESSLKPHDFISVRHDDGTLLVSEKGQEIRGGQVHLQPPVFPTDHGVMRMSAEKYRDHEARILAWHRLQGYPLVSYVGLSENDLFAAQNATAESYRQIATAASVLFLIVALIGMHFSTRLAWRKKQADEVKRTYHLAIDDAREGFYMVRAIYADDNVLQDFVIEDCNERGASLLGHLKKTLIGTKVSEVKLGQDPQQCLSIYRRAMEIGFYEDEFQFVDALPGQPSWVHRRLVRSDTGLAVTLRDISETKENEQLLLTMANTDALTGLPNRYWLINFLPTALRNAKNKNTILAILFIDLDNFKNVNDTLGHAMGDKLLRQAAGRLKSVLRSEDHVIRLGGDEFTVLLNSVANHEEVVHVASRITESFREAFVILGREMRIGTSLGISMFPKDGEEPDSLIQKADIAMYAAKDEGKGTFHFYDQQLYEGIRTKLNAEAELVRAISENQFVMHYQPRVNAYTGKLTGLEALVRWKHPRRGLILPGEFIPLAEKNGCIVQLGELVIDQVCAQIAEWMRDGESLVPVSVNISPSQLNAGGIDVLIAGLLESHGIPSHTLEVELTESAMMSESADVIGQVAAIGNVGVKIHLDDFGTGYSSLSRLQEIDMHIIKVDQAFTSKLGVAREGEILFKTIVLMAKALDMGVIAEGVETEAQLRILRELSCDEVQGYLISRPLPAADIVQLMRRQYLLGDMRLQ